MSSLKAIARKLRQHGETFLPLVEDEVATQTALKVRDLASQNAPVDTGDLANGFRANVEGRQLGDPVIVTNERDYGVFVNAKTGFFEKAYEEAADAVPSALEQAMKRHE